MTTTLLSQTVVAYENNNESLVKLKFRLSKLMHEVFSDNNRLRMAWGPKEATSSPEVSDSHLKSGFTEILSLTGMEQVKQFENWFSELARGVSGWDISNAANGVTGSFLRGNSDEPGAAGIIRSALQEGIRVITLTMDDLRLISSAEDLRNLIKKRYCGLFVHRVL